MLKRIFRRIGDEYLKRRCLQEYEGQQFRWVNERPIEYRFVFQSLNRIQPKYVLDVGVGQSALPSLLRTCGFVVSATDNVTDYWPSGMVNRHFHVIDDDITATKVESHFDAVLCISTLEHIVDHDSAMSSMVKLLRPGGHLVVTCPFHEDEYVKNVYDLPTSMYGKGNPYICQSFSRRQLGQWQESNPIKIVDQEYWRCFTGTYWTEGSLVRPPEQSTESQPHQLMCVLFKKSH